MVVGDYHDIVCVLSYTGDFFIITMEDAECKRSTNS